MSDSLCHQIEGLTLYYIGDDHQDAAQQRPTVGECNGGAHDRTFLFVTMLYSVAECSVLAACFTCRRIVCR